MGVQCPCGHRYQCPCGCQECPRCGPGDLPPSRVSGAIGRSLANAAAGYRRHLSGLLDAVPADD